MGTVFSKEDTKIIKGIAIFLMLMHHLWAFPERIAGEGLQSVFTIFGESAALWIGRTGKICVSIFFFVGGYGIYKSSQQKRFNLIGRIKGLYFTYWKVFIVFIPLAFLFFSNQPIYCASEDICNRYAEFSWLHFWSDFWGLTTYYNNEWWFLGSYICALITYPFVEKIIRGFSAVTNIVGVVIASILVTSVFPALGNLEVLGNLNSNYLYSTFFCQTAPTISCFWMGCVMAKDDLLVQGKHMLWENHLLNPIADIVLLVMTAYLRSGAMGMYVDIIFVPLMIIVSLDLLKYLKLLRKIFLKLGKQSTNMWLIHTFFCYYFYGVVKLVIWPRYAVLSLLVLVVITYTAAVVLTCFWNYAGKGMGKIAEFYLAKVSTWGKEF